MSKHSIRQQIQNYSANMRKSNGLSGIHIRAKYRARMTEENNKKYATVANNDFRRSDHPALQPVMLNVDE